MTPVSFPWSELITALRSELEGFGELLRLIENQRDSILLRDPESLLAHTGEINQYIPTLESLSAKRQHLHKARTELGTEPETLNVREIAAYAPEDFRPLLEALLEESQNLVQTTRKQMQRNQILLQKAHSMNTQLLNAVHPQRKGPSTYGKKGTLSGMEPLAGARYATRT